MKEGEGNPRTYKNVSSRFPSGKSWENIFISIFSMRFLEKSIFLRHLKDFFDVLWSVASIN